MSGLLPIGYLAAMSTFMFGHERAGEPNVPQVRSPAYHKQFKGEERAETTVHWQDTLP